MVTPKRILVTAIVLMLLFSAALAPLGPQPVQAAVLVDEDFKGTTAPDWTFGGNPNAPTLTEANPAIDGATPEEDGWLRLTDALNDQSGFVFYDNAIPSGNGLVVEFDYAIFGGNDLNGTGADGFTFFLMDGTAAAPIPGAFGGSLGYAQRDNDPATAPNPEVPGLTQGYIGIGFDEYGNYANPTEGRIGGPGFQPNWISIRGPYDPTDPALGYEFLAGTDVSGGDLRANDPAPGENHPDQNGVDYRHAVITITQTGEVTVQVQFGQGQPLQTIVDSQPIGIAAPPTVKFGFAASTGTGTNIHEIRNFVVTEIVDVAVAKTHGGSFTPGEQGTYTVTVSNVTPPPSTATATNISITDTLPAGLTFVSGTGTNWTCSAAGQEVSCDYGGGIPPGGSASVDILVNVGEDVTGALNNRVTVSALGDSNTDNNTATDSIAITEDTPTPEPIAQAPGSIIIDPALVKLGDVQQAQPGEQITWTLIATNNGNVPLTEVTVTDSLDQRVFTPIQDATIDAGLKEVNGHNVTFILGTLNPGETIVMTITASVLGDVVPPMTADNTAFLDAAEIDEPIRADSSISIPTVAAEFPSRLPETGDLPDFPTRLPATGYPPQPQTLPAETGLLLIVGGGGLLGAGLLLHRRRR